MGARADQQIWGYGSEPPRPSVTSVTPEEVLMLYGRAWFERDQADRVEALRIVCTEDVRFMDPQLGVLHGLEAVADMIGSYMGRARCRDTIAKRMKRRSAGCPAPASLSRW